MAENGDVDVGPAELPSQLSQEELLDKKPLDDDEAKAHLLQKLRPIFKDRYKMPSSPEAGTKPETNQDKRAAQYAKLKTMTYQLQKSMQD